MGQFWPWGTPITLTDCKPQGTNRRPWTANHRVRQRPKKAKRALNPNIIKNDHSDGQDPKQSRWSKMAKIQNFRPNPKDNGDKPPSWMIPKVNQDDEDQRGPPSWAIMGIYIHISIINRILSKEL
ncbi:hypothetical protein O181_033649 [Austropuccinia psidii MF-1]|uniref:Uncharacterized protein n=1 Tax=Austropuccinia psidii MF-1 TaxID=1389203 RepID=A0A9Q3CZ62_9BASI|nr:hypothetical protein [Austropuccinia psidii MF-1]